MTWQKFNRYWRAIVARIHLWLLAEPIACLLFVLLCLAPIGFFLYYLTLVISQPPQSALTTNQTAAISRIEKAVQNIQQPLSPSAAQKSDLQSALQELQTLPPSKTIFPTVSSYRWAFGFALAAGIIALFLSGFHSGRLLKNFSKWIRQIIKPISMGATVALLFVGFYFLLLERTNLGHINYDSVMAAVLGIYLTVCGMFVGFHGVFFEKIPILDIETLMEEMQKDIAECTNRICWSFPGLSFGSISVAGPLYDKFHEDLESRMREKTCNTEFYVLKPDEIALFYAPYEERAKKKRNAEEVQYALDRVKVAREDSGQLLKTAETYARSKSFITGGCQTYYVDHDFRHQVIVIDSNVYFLHSIGLPKKIEGAWEFTSENHVDFIATKLVNGSLAGALCEAISDEHRTIEKKKESRNEAL